MNELGFSQERPNVTVRQATTSGEGEKYIKGKKTITIHIDEQEGYPNYAFLSHNGDAIQIQRGVDVTVDMKYVNILRDAIAHRVVQRKVPTGDGAFRMTMDLKPYHVYPWHVVAE